MVPDDDGTDGLVSLVCVGVYWCAHTHLRTTINDGSIPLLAPVVPHTEETNEPKEID